MNPNRKLISRMAKDISFRRDICLRSHYWFFHAYFTKFIKYPCADMHKEMFYFSEISEIKRVVLTGFPKCGKSLIFSYSLPLWSIINGQAKNIIILLRNKEERKEFRDKFQQELFFNSQLLHDFNIKFKKKGLNNILFTSHNARIYIGSLEEDLDIIANNDTDLIIVDPLYPLKDSEYDEVYEKLKEVFQLGGEKTRKIIVGRGAGKNGPLNRLQEKMYLNKNFLEEQPYRFPFLKGEEALWKSRFPTEESITEEVNRGGTKESFFFEYFLFDKMVDIPLIINPENNDNTYPVDIDKWEKLKPEEKNNIKEIFFVPYQGKNKCGRILWGIKIDKDGQELNIYQGIIWEKDFDEEGIIKILDKFREVLDKMNKIVIIAIYADRTDKFSAEVSKISRPGYWFASYSAFRDNSSQKKEWLQAEISQEKLFFREDFKNFLSEKFLLSEDKGASSDWVNQLSLLYDFSIAKGSIMVFNTYNKPD